MGEYIYIYFLSAVDGGISLVRGVRKMARIPELSKIFCFLRWKVKSEYKELRHSRICKDEIFIQLEVGEILSGMIQVVRL